MANLRVDKITSTETFEKTGSVQFDGSGDYLYVSGTNQDFAYGTGDFTVEFWINTSNWNIVPFDTRPSGTDGDYFTLYIDVDGALTWYEGGAIKIQGSDGVIVQNTWVHIAATRKGTSAKLFVNGVQTGPTFTDNTDYVTTANRPFIGSQSRSGGSSAVNGYLSNFRVIKGTALYTSNFKPPMRELEVTAETVLLACQSKTDASLEKTGKTITVNGNAVANELTPGILTPIVKSGGGSAITGSVEFDGTGDYLSITESSDFDFGADDFTMEYWYHEGNDDRTERRVLYCYDSNQAFTLGHTNDNGGQLFFSAHDSGNNLLSGGIVRTASNSNPTGKRNYWRHVAACREGATFRIFIDGVLQNTANFGTTAIRGDQNTLYIGQDPNNTTTRNFRGFLSNIRINKGTALYTADFIPPTRELKRVPGTVLLCCQDPDSPLTEATGKTITGYGDLSRTDIGVDLVTNGDFSVDTSGWTVLNTGTFTASGGQATLSDSDGTGTSPVAYQSISTFIPGAMYVFQFDTTATREAYAYVSTSAGDNALDMSSSYAYPAYSGSLTGTRYIKFRATQSTMIINFSDGSGSDFDVTVDNVKVYKLDPGNRASNFTPQVGDDRQVTFEGVTKIDTDAYFYFPTGDTASRYPTGTGGAGAGTRGVVFGGYYPSSPNRSDVIDYVTIASTGNAFDFGDRLNNTDTCAACASATRALNAGGYDGSATINTIEYVTIASTGNASKFGELDLARRNRDGCASSTRGLFGGGYPTDDAMEYVTIATSGISSLFGNLTVDRYNLGALASPVRGVFGGGTPSTDTMDFVTIATTADAIDFGNLTAANTNVTGTSSETRGIFGFHTNVINYITIASTGDAQEFGDLNYNPSANACTSSLIRGIFMGGGTPVVVNTISYITIASTGDAVDFGDLTQARQSLSATSSGHGGLG